MNTYIITYDLHTPGQNYEDLLKKIKRYEAWAKIWLSAYIVESSVTALAIRNDLQSVLDINDKLFVWVIRAPAAWSWLGDEVSKWLMSRLK